VLPLVRSDTVKIGRPYRIVRETIGIWADVVTVLLSLGAVGGIAVWLRNHAVPAWLLVIVGAAAIALYVLGHMLGRRSVAGDEQSVAGLQRRADRLTEDVTVTSNYLRVINDTLSELRDVFARPEPQEALKRLASLRALVVNAVVQGLSSARTEHVRCAYFVPRDIDGEVRLCIKYHQGHTATGEAKLHLLPDRRSIAGTAFVDRASVYVPDAPNDPRFQTTEGGRTIGTLYCVPVFGYTSVGAEPIGVFSVASNRPGAFDTAFDRQFVSVSANAFSLLEFVASTIELALENESLPAGDAGASDETDNLNEPDRR
jgi:hypothetical protein